MTWELLRALWDGLGLFSWIPVLAGIAFLITSVFSRRRAARNCKPSYLLAVVGAFCAALVMSFVFHNRDLFMRDFWDAGVASVVLFLSVNLAIFMVIGFAPAWLVVWYYRRGLKNEQPVV